MKLSTNIKKLSDAGQAFLKSKKLHFIDGKSVASKKDAYFETFDPATGAPIAKVARGKKADIDKAVKSAREALDGEWSRLKPSDRELLLLKLADVIEAHAGEIAEIETLNNGKSIALAKAVEVGDSVRQIRYMAGWATKIEGSTLDVSMPGRSNHRAFTLKEPIGVVGAIVPWNFPFMMAVWKIAPALACGCTVVLKPAEETPLTALKLAELVQEAGFPDGVVNVVTGLGEEAGAALAAHPGIDKLAFTGSTEIGQLVGQAALKNMTRFSLELGGKSPMIMLEDMNLRATSHAAHIGSFFNQGQVCTAGSRVYVHKKIYDKVVADFAAVAERLPIGEGFNPKNQINPLISERHKKRVMSYVDAGIASGAEMVCGGDQDGDGYYVKPTLFANVDEKASIVQEEIFGPVIVAMPFDDIDDVIERANNTQFGLAASIWSNNLTEVMNLIPRIKAGTVWVNAHNLTDPNLPFGGYKYSGMGRENGRMALEQFLETKSVSISY